LKIVGVQLQNEGCIPKKAFLESTPRWYR